MRIKTVVWQRALLAAAVQSALVATALFPRSADGASITWMGANNDWVDAGSTALWSPADEPDADDTAIFNSANVVNLGSNNSIIALTMSGGIDLNTNTFNLDVNGLVQLVDANTNLIVGPAGSLLTADAITINNGGNLELNGGTAQINEESGNGVLDINVGGALVGHGTLSMTDAVAAGTTLIVNDGAITARRGSLVIFGAPVIGTLSINATDTDARIDLDGAGELGAVNVNRNQTLDINIQLADIFNGSITMAQNTTLDMSNPWTLGANATLDVNNGFVPAVFPNPSIPASTSTIAGASFTQNSGTINVVDADGTLVFEAPFTMNGGSLVNNGLVVFDSSATIAAAANFTMPTASSSITVAAGRTVAINQNNFNLDGGNSATNTITVHAGGTLNISTTDYDPDSVTNVFDGTVTLNGGAIDITTADAEFVMDGVLNMNATSGSFAGWLGEPVDIGNDSGLLDAALNVTGSGGGDAQFGAQVDFNSDADVNVAAGGTLVFLTNSTVNFHTVNAANNAEFTGAGIIEFNGAVNVVEAATLNLVGGTVDLDGSDSVGETINVDAPFTINAATLTSFGRTNGVGTNLLDINNSVGTGVLTVTLANPASEWTLNGPGVINLVNDNTAATLLAGSDVNINGTVNVTGDVRTTARLDIAGVVNINTATEPLRLAGGNNTNDPNTIAGGTISGAGVLGADDGKALHGFGTINTNIDFDGAAPLRADGGTLTINGSILDAGQVGTADLDGILQVTNAWNNNVTTGVQLNGGTLSGGTMTNDVAAGISGHGLVTARVINNTQLFASIGDTLIFQTGANDNDWDGSLNAGEIEAVSANIELRDVGAAFGFAGTVRASNNHTAFANGFALDFNPGSTLALASGGTYRSTQSTDIGGTVSVGGSESTIQVANNNFLTFESGSATTLNANLRLVNNNINIEAGATFSGAGAIVIPDGSHMVADNLANIGVLLDMQGAFRPGNFEGIGRISLLDYQQADTGELFVELRGTSLNAFDRLVASGDAVLDGYLNLDIDEVSPGVPFVPALGQTFNIITANTVTGEFDFADISGMPNGLTFGIEYLPNAVQLQVVTTPFFSADFDNDGDVDNTDLAIWRGAFDLNQLGDADGDNDTDGADLLLWQRQFGSRPGSSAASTVPEPTSLVALLLACFTCAKALGRHRRATQVSNSRGPALCIRLAIVSSVLAFVLPHTAMAQTVNLSLNLQYTNPANPPLGGAWTLVAKTDSAHGIAAINAILANINAAGITAQSGIGAVLNGGNPFVTNNISSVEVVYFQDLSTPASVVTNVGRGAGTPGNLALDPLNDPAWNNSARIFWGTFAALTPAFTSNANNPPDVTAANVLSTGVPPYTFAAPASITTIVRNNLLSSDIWDNTSGSGFWSNAANWTDDSEPGAPQEAIFPAGFPNGDVTITLAAGENARRLTLHDSYTLTGGALTLNEANSVLHVAPGKTATIASALTASGNLQVSGGGNAVVSHVRATGGLHLLSSPLKVAPGGGNTGTSRVATVQINAGQRLDLSDHKLIVTDGVVGTFTAGAYSGLTGLIASSYNFGAWDGPGIATSMPDAGPLIGITTLAISTADETFYAGGTFGGLAVHSGDVLIMYTYAGDLNLDGLVDAADYGTIDNWVQFPGTSGYANGDFNYDGVIDAGDYGIIDNTIQLQGPPIPANGAGLDLRDATAVPEPALLSALALAAGALLARRLRRPR